MSEHKLGPLPEPDNVGLGAMHAYHADQMRAYALAEVRRAVEMERERCAKLCEVIADDISAGGEGTYADVASFCASKIREGP